MSDAAERPPPGILIGYARVSTEDQDLSLQLDALVKAVEDKSDQLATLLQDSGVDFRRFVEVFRRALIQNEDLLRADAGSLLQSCMNACTDGLLPVSLDLEILP